MPMTVETALITRKGKNAEYNTDSLNASGKTWPRETVHSEKGIKAVGTGKNVPYYVLASSSYKGTAESAADLFKSCTDIFSPDLSNSTDVISEFYISFVKVLSDAGFVSSDCDLAVFCGYGNTVHISKCGGAKLYRYAEGKLAEVIPPMHEFADKKSSFGVSSFSDVQVGDIFILLNGNVAQVLPDDLVAAICASADGDIKKIVSVFSSQADKYNCKGAVSAIVIKVTEVEAAVAAAPVVTGKTTAPVEEKTTAEPAAENEEREDESKSEESENEKISTGRKVAFGIVIGIFVILVALLLGLTIRGISRRGEVDVTTSETTTEESTEEESTTRENEETTTEAQSTEAETTTEKTAEQTTQRPTERTTERVTDPPTTETVLTTLTPSTEQESTTAAEEPTEAEPTEEPGTQPEETTDEQPVTEEPSEESSEITDAPSELEETDAPEISSDETREEENSGEVVG